MQTSRDCVIRAIDRNYPDRIPICLNFDIGAAHTAITHEIIQNYDTDIIVVCTEDPEFIPVQDGYNQWGYRMETFGDTMGEVKDPPLSTWDCFEQWKSRLPDFTVMRRYESLKYLRQTYPEKYLVGGLGMMMEEIINLRGYENCMIDYYEEEDNLNKLIDLLYSIGKQQVDGYAEAGLDAVIAWEDWGLQHSPMMAYSMWKEFYYDRMKDFVSYIHRKGMKYILHSCGHITYLLDTFIDIGVDVIQMDQQMNMGLDLLNTWQNKICFFCPVDIQHSVQMSAQELREYSKDMIQKLGSLQGGFMYKAYAQPAAINMNATRLKEEIELMQQIRYPSLTDI